MYMTLKQSIFAGALMVAGVSAQAQVVVKHIQPNEKASIATAVWAGDTLYVSGTLADAITPADATKGTPADYGDTKTQTTSILTKVQKILKDQGLDMKNASFSQFFGTKDQPNKPARSAFQVANLVGPGYLLEIEFIAVKGK
jgi:2-iminobutanoate/2-iminopropanoate deaminase